MKPSTPPLGPAAAELYARVQAATEDTPYTVTTTPYGFDVAVDVDHPTWRGLFYRQKVKELFTHRVAVDEPNRKLTITDLRRQVTWRADGTPSLGADLEFETGRINQKSTYLTFGRRADGTFGKIDESHFSSAAGRRLITEPADELGWTQNLPTTAKISLVFGVIGGGLALVVLVLLILTLA